MAQRMQYGEIFWALMTVLRDAPEPLPGGRVVVRVRETYQPTAYEQELVKSGGVRWEVALHFQSGEAATVGWMTKRNGWSITEAGLAAMDAFPSPNALDGERVRLYREIDEQRRRAQETLSDVQQFIASTLLLVDAGSWTAHDDLADLSGTTANEVAYFLASGKVKLENAYRVLNADGSIPAEGMLNAAYRGSDLLRRLEAEGVHFDEAGHASQPDRLDSQALRALIEERAEESADTSAAVRTAPRRAWMVRGSNVDGYNIVPDWLREGFVSLSASRLDPVQGVPTIEELRERVAAGYQHKSYAYQAQRIDEFDRFLRRMQVGDLVLTTSHGQVYLGTVDGPAYFTDSPESLSNLRRAMQWHADHPLDASRLTPPVPALLQSQDNIVDLTDAYQQLGALLPEADLPEAPPPAVTPRPLSFHPITAEFADDLLLDKADLEKITRQLWERKQIVLYGPPGTGKTWLAEKLARHLTDEGAVQLVQFHPSYTYEDFFEGFRPKAGNELGTLAFALTPGPFRVIAEAAEDNKTTPYILIIDEINRANLAKVFGELYYLLEYRDHQISLQYSPGTKFTLPENLFIIGTMNTADRSIARIDAAMRRRFRFVALDPRMPPVQGLLARWLKHRDLPLDAALILDELNRRIDDADAAIGPSYLMDERIYQRPDGLDEVWEYAIMPLLQDLFYGERDLAARYGLANLRKAVTGLATDSESPPDDETWHEESASGQNADIEESAGESG